MSSGQMLVGLLGKRVKVQWSVGCEPQMTEGTLDEYDEFWLQLTQTGTTEPGVWRIWIRLANVAAVSDTAYPPAQRADFVP